MTIERARGWLPCSLAALLLASGCGEQVQYGEGPAECPPTAGGEQGTPDELSELMAELIAPRICERAVGSFIGLPGEETHEGAAGGLDPSVGRWWIRQCAADVVDGQLRVGIGGPGWTWLDRQSTGFRVRQYLRFEGRATFTASLHVGYDGRARVASIWLRPAPGVAAQVQPTGLVQAEATDVFSSVLGGILDLTGSSASDRARAQAAEEGSQRLRERLATGFTVTYSLDTEQMDFLLGELPRGQVPQRPWPANGSAWLVNERSAVWPGGMDVLGPLPEDADAATLDVQLEEGDGAVLHRVCAEELHRWLDAAWSGSGGRAGSPPGERLVEMTGSGGSRSVRLEPVDCRSLLVVSPRSGTTLPAMLRYRVTPIVSAETGAAGPEVAASASGASASPAAHGPSPSPSPGHGATARATRIRIRSVSVAAQNAGGGSWDVFSGAPDPYVVATSIPGGRELDRTPVVDDDREARFDRWVPGAVRAEDFPIRFIVYDEDVAGDEVVGVADLEADAMPAASVEITLDLRSQGERPARTGMLRLSLSPVDR